MRSMHAVLGFLLLSVDSLPAPPRHCSLCHANFRLSGVSWSGIHQSELVLCWVQSTAVQTQLPGVALFYSSALHGVPHVLAELVRRLHSCVNI